MWMDVLVSHKGKCSSIFFMTFVKKYRKIRYNGEENPEYT